MDRRSRWVASTSWVVCVGSALSALALLVPGIGRSTPGDDFVLGGWGGVAFALAAVAFGTVGALVSRRLPDNGVGWLFCVIGTGFAVGDLTYQYADQALFGRAAGWPGGELAVVLQNLTVPPCFGLLAVSLMLFPDGRLPSRRWRPAVAVALIGSAAALLGYALRPGPADAPFDAATNPVGVPGGFGVFGTMANLSWPLMGLGLVLAAAAMRHRSRRATGLERQQLKWVTFGGAVAGAMIAADVASFYVGVDFVDLNLVRIGTLAIGFTVVPVACGVAILRYRLYDIDVVINRALVYGSLTAALAGVYVGSVLLLQLALSGITQGSSLAVAASTLAVAALFGPARARIQRMVDRRFFRSRYDAVRTLEAFGVRLRDEVDLDELSGDLRAVVDETMRPMHVSIWLRATEGAT